MRYSATVRLLLIGIGGANALWIWLDPYTQSLDAASPFIPSPWWRWGLAMFELAILILYCWNAWKMHFRNAALLLIVSLLHSTITNAIYVWLDGIQRFMVVYFTEQILSIYLAMLSLRLAALLIIAVLFLPRERLQPSSG